MINKPIFVFWLIMLLVTVIAITGSYSILQTHHTHNKALLENEYNSCKSGQMMSEALRGIDKGVLIITSEHWNEGRRIIEEEEIHFRQGIKLGLLSTSDPHTEEMIKRIEEHFSTLSRMWIKPIIGHIAESDYHWYQGSYVPAHEDTQAYISQFQQYTETKFHTSLDEMRSSLLMLSIPLLSGLLLVFFSFTLLCIKHASKKDDA